MPVVLVGSEFFDSLLSFLFELGIGLLVVEESPSTFPDVLTWSLPLFDPEFNTVVPVVPDPDVMVVEVEFPVGAVVEELELVVLLIVG